MIKVVIFDIGDTLVETKRDKMGHLILGNK